MARKAGLGIEPVAKAKINPKPKLPKPYKGKALRDPKVQRSGSKPAGGGKKGY